MAADRANVMYIETLREMRATRTQQLKQGGQQQQVFSQLNRTLSNLITVTNTNNQILKQVVKGQQDVVRTNREMSKDLRGFAANMTRSITSLSVAVGRGAVGAAGVAARGTISTVAGAASTAGGIASSIVNGLSKALPVALVGLVGKAFIWDNLDANVKSNLLGSMGKLFTYLLDSLKPIFEKLLDSLKGLLKMAAIEITAAMRATKDIIQMGFGDLTKKLREFVAPLEHTYKTFSRFLERIGGFLNEYGPALGVGVAGVGAASLLKPQVANATAAATAATLGGSAARSGTSAVTAATVTAANDSVFKGNVANAGRNKQAIDFMKKNGFKGTIGRGELVSGRIFLRMFESVPEASKNIVLNAMKLRGFTLAGALTVAMEFVWVQYAKSEIDVLEKEELLTGEEANELRSQITIKAAGSTVGTILGGALMNAGSSALLSSIMTSKAPSWIKFGAGAIKFGATLYGAAKGGELGGRGAEEVYKNLTKMNLIKNPSNLNYEELIAKYNEGLGKGMTPDQAMAYAKGSLPQASAIPTSNLSTTSSNTGNLGEFISQYESRSGKAGYNQLFLNPKTGKPFVTTPGNKQVTQMSVGEVLRLQEEQIRKTKDAGIGISDKTGKAIGTGAIGKYQFTNTTLKELLKKLGVKEDAIFDEALQDRLFNTMIKNDYNAFIAGEITSQEFSDLIAMKWEAFRGPKAKKELDAYLAKSRQQEGSDSILAQANAIREDTKDNVDYASEWLKKYEEYRRQGYDDLEAKEKAKEDVKEKAGESTSKFKSFLGGMISPSQIQSFTQAFDIEKIKSDIKSDAALLSNVLQIKGSEQQSGGGNVNNNFNIVNQNSSGGGGSSTSVSPPNTRDSSYRFYAATDR